MVIVSSIAGRSRAPSLRMWAAYTPPYRAATFESAISSPVEAKVSGA